MNEHLALKVRGKYANLPEDFSIDIEDVNPIFNDYESYSFDAEIFGQVGILATDFMG